MNQNEKKKPLVYVPMAADIIHPGHINILKTAFQYGDVMVGLLSDEAVASYKRVPYMTFEQRKIVVENIKYVNCVVKQANKDYEENLKKYKPKYMIHGKDWRDGPLKPEREKAIKLMLSWGGEVIEPDYTKGISSTIIQEKIKNRIDY